MFLQILIGAALPTLGWLLRHYTGPITVPPPAPAAPAVPSLPAPFGSSGTAGVIAKMLADGTVKHELELLHQMFQANGIGAHKDSVQLGPLGSAPAQK